MIARFMTVFSFLLIFSMIGCGEDSDSIVKPEIQPVASPTVFENVLISENVRAAAQPLPSLPSKQEEVAAAAPALAVIPAVVTAISCGATVFEVGTLILGTPDFLANQMLAVSVAGIACPVDKPIKGIKILKSANTLQNTKFWNFIPANMRKNFGALKGRAVQEGYEVHHTIPQKYRAKAKERGINIDQPWFGAEITEGYHRQITNAYEKEWDIFFQGKNPTRSDILLFRKHVSKKFHLEPGDYLDVIK